MPMSNEARFKKLRRAFLLVCRWNPGQALDLIFTLDFLEILVDLVGIEPTTSSMPWKRAPSCATGPRENTCTRG